MSWKLYVIIDVYLLDYPSAHNVSVEIQRFPSVILWPFYLQWVLDRRVTKCTVIINTQVIIKCGVVIMD